MKNKKSLVKTYKNGGKKMPSKLPSVYNFYYGVPQYADGGKNERIWKDIGAGAYGVGEGLLDTMTMGATDQLTDIGYKALQKAGNSTEDEIREQNSIAGYGKAAGAITGALTGLVTPEAAIGTASKGIGQGISYGSADDPNAQMAGQAVGSLGQLASMGMGLSGGLGAEAGAEGVTMASPSTTTGVPNTMSPQQVGMLARYGGMKYKLGGVIKTPYDNKIAITDIRMFKDGGLSSGMQRVWDNPNKKPLFVNSLQMFKNGGQIVAELEGGENYIKANNGGFVQLPDSAPSHEEGGVKLTEQQIPTGSIIFSDKLKVPGTNKTFAEVNKKNDTSKLDKKFDKMPDNQAAKNAKEELRKAMMINSQNLFAQQEALKQQKVNNYAKRLGLVPSRDNETTEPMDLPESNEGEYAMARMGGMYMAGGQMMVPTVNDYMRNEDYNSLTYANGGRLPEGILRSRLEAHMSPEEANNYIANYGNGGMIKRADGTYSKRGLWDNIRANAGSGKEPTKEMLEQEAKINAEYAMGGMMMENGGTMPKLTNQQVIDAAKHESGWPMSNQYLVANKENPIINSTEWANTADVARINSMRIKYPGLADKIYLDDQTKEKYNPNFKASDKILLSNYRVLEIAKDLNPEKISYDDLIKKYGKYDAERLKKAYNNSVISHREGGIHINPANKGKFTASAERAGMGVQEFARHVLANKEDYSSTQVKRANFARNAAGWKHEMGGVQQYNMGGNTGEPMSEADFKALQNVKKILYNSSKYKENWQDPKFTNAEAEYARITGVNPKPISGQYAKGPNDPSGIVYNAKFAAPENTTYQDYISKLRMVNTTPIVPKGNVMHPDYQGYSIPGINDSYNQAKQKAQILNYGTNNIANETISQKRYGGINYNNESIIQYVNGGPAYDPSKFVDDYDYSMSGLGNVPQGVTEVRDNSIADFGNRNDFNQSLAKGINEFNAGNTGFTDAGKTKDYSGLINAGTQIGMGLLQNAGNMYDIYRGSKPETETYERYTPTTLTANEILRRNQLGYAKGKEGLAAASQGSGSAYRQNLKDLALKKMYADAKSIEEVNNLNAEIRNKAGMFNTELAMRETIANAQNRAANRDLMSSGMSGIGKNVSSQVKDYRTGSMDQKTLNAIIASNPQWANSAEGKAYIAQFKK